MCELNNACFPTDFVVVCYTEVTKISEANEERVASIPPENVPLGIGLFGAEGN